MLRSLKPRGTQWAAAVWDRASGRLPATLTALLIATNLAACSDVDAEPDSPGVAAGDADGEVDDPSGEETDEQAAASDDEVTDDPDDDSVGDDSAGDGADDMTADDAVAEDTASCEPVPASEPFGSDPEAGESLPDIQVSNCDGDRVTFDEFRCGNRLTLFSIGAGWCEPCREEAPQLQALHENMADEGVGVVQVLFEDGEGNAATGLFCDIWTEEFGLTLPVLVDPLARSLDLFPRGMAPLNVLVDEQGQVLWAIGGIIPPDLEGTIRGFMDDMEDAP